MSPKYLGRRLGAVAAASVALTLIATGSAHATPPDPGVTGTILWQRTVGDTDLILREIHLPPHTDTGWHYHDGRLFAKVERGTLTHFDATCRSDGVYPAGHYLTEPSGPAHVHIGRNLGSTELVLEVLYILPTGSPLAEDAPNPGCDFE